MHTKDQIINKLIKKYNYKTYLEIGIDRGVNFNKISCPFKIGIDPDKTSPASLHATSDEFFERYGNKFDIIFIDGLHTEAQVLKDIKNSLQRLNKNGTIVIHDCNPTSEIAQREIRETYEWYGTVWKAWVRYRKQKNLEMHVVDTDYGVGIMRRGKQKPLKVKGRLTYANLDKNREEWLNLKKVV
jgi:hypothetical protein